MPRFTFYVRIEIDDDAPELIDIEKGKAITVTDENMERKLKHQRGNRQSKPLVVETLKSSNVVAAAAASAAPQKQQQPSKAEVNDTISFFSGNPFVEKTQGILHLYKRNDSENAAASSSISPAAADGPSKMLCMVAVSAKFTSHDLLQFLAPYESAISKIRIIRDSSPNQYMVLLEFRDQPSADDCYKSCDGKPFNGIEKDICYLVYVSHLEVMKESEGAGLPVEKHTELPTCPVCLERMDETVDGILTVLCNHSFHGNCLLQWGDASCPVCRYSQTPELTSDQACSVCGKQEDLWLCLICGHTGCGRYAEAHAHLHYQQTQHTFSLEVGGQRVWDYAGDNYVHRLILSKSDGKVVEFEGPTERAAVLADEKVDAVTLEYTYLLTNQLESQRLYFEEKMTSIEKMMQSQLEVLKKENATVIGECENLRGDLKRLIDEKRQLEKKLSQANAKATKASTELKTELDTNAILRDDQQKWSAAVRGLEEKLKTTMETKDKEISDLQEQVRDLLFHFEAEKQLDSLPDEQKDEIPSARMTVGAAAPKSVRKKHK